MNIGATKMDKGAMNMDNESTDMNICEGLVQRRKVHRENRDGASKDISNSRDQTAYCDDSEDNSKGARLTLMEEILLLGLKDKTGYASFWNDSISAGLRGCIMIELGLRGRIELDKAGFMRRNLLNRKILLKDSSPTGEVLLDEAMKNIKEAETQETMESWIDYLTGETWNPMKLRYQIKNVRERLAKNLVEKGVLTSQKQNFVLFDMTTHPLSDNETKVKLLGKIQDALLRNWTNDPQAINTRVLSLVLMAQASDVIESALSPLNDEDYELARKRVEALQDLNFEAESRKVGANVPMWAVFAALCN